MVGVLTYDMSFFPISHARIVIRDEREKSVQEEIRNRQKTRMDNIAARSQAKKQKKLGIRPKAKQQSRPGFEGGRKNPPKGTPKVAGVKRKRE